MTQSPTFEQAPWCPKPRRNLSRTGEPKRRRGSARASLPATGRAVCSCRPPPLAVYTGAPAIPPGGGVRTRGRRSLTGSTPRSNLVTTRPLFANHARPVTSCRLGDVSLMTDRLGQTARLVHTMARVLKPSLLLTADAAHALIVRQIRPLNASMLGDYTDH